MSAVILRNSLARSSGSQAAILPEIYIPNTEFVVDQRVTGRLHDARKKEHLRKNDKNVTSSAKFRAIRAVWRGNSVKLPAALLIAFFQPKRRNREKEKQE
ncbi:hypothetical protein [Antarctobacter heliothermus]|uniref:hypothetical protein n=1 Tax=Antarctobacter heliothermus TaxID=74033 RepID=UPI0012FE65E0|nr:hypothetical protein [Antarctobacter heliothermus]